VSTASATDIERISGGTVTVTSPGNNTTLDVGVQANVVTITGSARADTINATTAVAGQPLPSARTTSLQAAGARTRSMLSAATMLWMEGEMPTG
jgi:hypothetical protein